MNLFHRNKIIPRIKIGIAIVLGFLTSTLFAKTPDIHAQKVTLTANAYAISEKIERIQEYVPEKQLAKALSRAVSSDQPMFQNPFLSFQKDSESKSPPTNTPQSSNSSLQPTSSINPNQTDTPVPTNTPRPTNTPVPLPTGSTNPTNTPVPLNTPTRTPTPTRIPSSPPATSTPKATSTPIPTSAPPPIACPQTSTRTYDTIGIIGPAETRDVPTHPDINVTVRGYSSVNELKSLFRIHLPLEPVDPPQLSTMADFPRQPGVVGTYRVNHWDWGSMRAGPAITVPPVTLAGIEVTPGMAIKAPRSGYHIGEGKAVMVLLAQSNRITLKYTREDSIAAGYAVHFEDICVDPNLVSLYNQMDAQGRTYLPALRAEEVLGVARTHEVKTALRDTGSFMDPRELEGWWEEYL